MFDSSYRTFHLVYLKHSTNLTSNAVSLHDPYYLITANLQVYIQILRQSDVTSYRT